MNVNSNAQKKTTPDSKHNFNHEYTLSEKKCKNLMALGGIAACHWGSKLKGTSVILRYYSEYLVVNKVHWYSFKDTAPVESCA